MLPYLIAGAIGYGIAKLFESDKAPKYADGGSILLAPNGKPSNLTPEQYKLVRTKAFKDWFGDWENDPENASKVVDENGEPKVMWHYSPNQFFVFNPNAKSRWTNQRKENVVWFGGTNKVISYSEGEKGFLYECFLNAKNPIIVDAKDYDVSDYYKDENGNKTYSIQRIKGAFVSKLGEVHWSGKKNDNDGIIFKNAWDNVPLGLVVAIINSNQIKLADGSNTTFDGNNPDIRFDGGGQLKYKNKGAYADVTQINKKEWYLNMIEAEIEEKGYAQKIMNQIINDAKIKKVEKITLDTSPMNKDYFEYGYGFVEKSYNDNDGLYRMELNLK